MQNLYPIIRRQRRPLIVAEPVTVVVGKVEPVQAVATGPVEPVVTENIPKVADEDATNY
jgi:hypothetical protein